MNTPNTPAPTLRHAATVLLLRQLGDRLRHARGTRLVMGNALVGVSADLKARGKDTISIIAGDRPDDHVSHIINGPTRVVLEETEEGAHKGLRIEAADGETTLLRFRSPALPETVDGVILR